MDAMMNRGAQGAEDSGSQEGIQGATCHHGAGRLHQVTFKLRQNDRDERAGQRWESPLVQGRESSAGWTQQLGIPAGHPVSGWLLRTQS